MMTCQLQHEDSQDAACGLYMRVLGDDTSVRTASLTSVTQCAGSRAHWKKRLPRCLYSQYRLEPASQGLLDDQLLGKGRVCHEAAHEASCPLQAAPSKQPLLSRSHADPLHLYNSAKDRAGA